MSRFAFLWIPVLPAALFTLGGAARAQTFQVNTAQIPQGSPFNDSYTEQVDFADVDLDGDWDAVFADGGNCCSDENRIWINQGGLQGGTPGSFLDETATRLPNLLATSRDVEFGDFENDGDPDLYVATTSIPNNQSSRWWINMGGAQGGTAGFYQDQTAARWVNLGGAGSSVSPSQVLPSGGFVDFTHDGEFADLDNDGDLDLVHSSYGIIFTGTIPTRLFLNNGQGAFEEFNPSGFQLSGQTIHDGEPGLWCEGLHQQNTTDNSGAHCDIATTALDVEVGDLDGDLDVDVLLGGRLDLPRLFANRLEEQGGTLAFRDVTTARFPPGYASFATAHFHQDFGDLDGDLDLDLFGADWQKQSFNYSDLTFANDGQGFFAAPSVVPGSSTFEDDVDCFDYDNDGDLDVFACSLQELVFQNDGTGALTPATGVLPVDGFESLDADSVDVDQDGDADVFVANDGGNPNVYLQNTNQVGDTRAPKVAHLEQVPDRIASAIPTVVRVHVYDNAPYYVTWYDAVTLEHSVNGGTYQSSAMRSSAGQVFRGELPGGLVGTIRYRVRAIDRSGNQGLSASLIYHASVPGPVTYCTAKVNSLGCVPAIGFLGVPSASMTSGFVVRGANVRNNKNGLLFYGVDGRASTPFQGGTLCVHTPVRRTGATQSGGNPAPANDCSGVYSLDMNAFAHQAGPPAPLAALTVVGTTVSCQWWGRDPGFAPPNATTLTDGLEYSVGPR